MMITAEEDCFTDPSKNNGVDAGVPSEGDKKEEMARGSDGDTAESQRQREGSCVEENIELAEMAMEMSEMKYCTTEGEDALLSIDNTEGAPGKDHEQQMDEDGNVMEAVEIDDRPSSLTPDAALSPGASAPTPPPSTPTTTAATPAPKPAPVPPATGKAESPSIAEKVDHCIIC
uniref:Uncharacterized protein n=1 Tax=Octopus bimaculoides TaxID=37653 RepID=A0A0L8FQL2_OCTBM